MLQALFVNGSNVAVPKIRGSMQHLEPCLESVLNLMDAFYAFFYIYMYQIGIF